MVISQVVYHLWQIMSVQPNLLSLREIYLLIFFIVRIVKNSNHQEKFNMFCNCL